MPIYEFKCTDCGRISEFLENTARPRSHSCPHCQSKNLQKLLSMFAPQVKPGSSKRCHGCSDNTCPHAGT